MEIKITNRHTGEVICSGETLASACKTHRASLASADLRGADLSMANLSGADLRGSDLSGADLRGADLSRADLSGANLRGANLRGVHLDEANLREADLRETDLSGACLYGADLRKADLRLTCLYGADLLWATLDGARLAWCSHDLIAEILRRAAGGDIEKRKIAGLILASRYMCWEDFLALQDPLTDWAILVLRKYVVPGDDAPEVLR